MSTERQVGMKSKRDEYEGDDVEWEEPTPTGKIYHSVYSQFSGIQLCHITSTWNLEANLTISSQRNDNNGHK